MSASAVEKYDGDASNAIALADILGTKRANRIKKYLGFSSVGELLNYFPRAYLRAGQLTPIAQLRPGAEVTIIARVEDVTSRKMKTRKGLLAEVRVGDGTGRHLWMSFFNGWTVTKELKVGDDVLFSGKVTEYRDQKTLTGPYYRVLDDIQEGTSLIPVYRASGKLTSHEIELAIRDLLESVPLKHLRTVIPPELEARHSMLPIDQAYHFIHDPRTEEQIEEARWRFKFEEALVLQTALAIRYMHRTRAHAVARGMKSDGLFSAFIDRLPFTLTAGQIDVLETISHELGSNRPMNRLLQGEVGSGKTVVALLAMLQVVDNGAQAVLLAPTEVLAMQHAESLRRLLGPLATAGQLGAPEHATKVTLLTGSMSIPEKRQALLDIASGEAGIVVGTHALLSDNVSFFDLGLVIVDEQHRFGVEQRDRLRDKSESVPHMLVMTATPIPRTVAMTVFGDLDTSALRELPRGRRPITTYAISEPEHPGWIRRTWQLAQEEIGKGHQVFVVCPKIGDAAHPMDEEPAPEDGSLGEDAPVDQARDMLGVLSVVERLRALPNLKGLRIEMLHGRMSAEDKSAAMAAFAAGEIDMLVATTVIEVGVDVPNATLMVVLDADRFGLAQLHQLRGRIGRGSADSTCILISPLRSDDPGFRRLAIASENADGFELAEEDLSMRNEGNILGAAQSGRRSALNVLTVKDSRIIQLARTDAYEIVHADPSLALHPQLAHAVQEDLDEDERAFLGRS